MKFVIDRSKWRCGCEGKFQLGEGTTLLENEQGYMCCLGQIIKQINSNVDILNESNPEGLNCSLYPLTTYNTIENAYNDSRLSFQAILINDDENLSNLEREEKLIELFNDNGHEIEFIN